MGGNSVVVAVVVVDEVVVVVAWPVKPYSEFRLRDLLEGRKAPPPLALLRSDLPSFTFFFPRLPFCFLSLSAPSTLSVLSFLSSLSPA